MTGFELVLSVLFFLVGLVFGKVLNEMVHRLVLRVPLLKGWSVCPVCGTTRRGRDILSWGSCRNGWREDSLRGALVEWGVALLFLGVFLMEGPTLVGVFHLVLGVLLFGVALVDLETGEIPDSLIAAFLVAGAFALLLPGPSLSGRLLGAAAVSIPMALFAKIREGSFGGGDVKLFAVLGFAFGVREVLVIGVLSSLAGFLGNGLVRLVRRERIRGVRVPFGPYVVGAALVVVFFGAQLAEALLGSW